MQKDKIFINYRRDDAGGFAGRLADSLGAYFGPGRVFRDVTGIDYGDDFERVIDEKLAESGALIVVIGDRWSTVTNASSNFPTMARPSAKSLANTVVRIRWRFSCRVCKHPRTSSSPLCGSPRLINNSPRSPRPTA